MSDILFKTEALLWEMMRDGRKMWDARLWDTADERVHRLAWFHSPQPEGQDMPPFRSPHPVGGSSIPVESEVSFQNKATGEVLTFEYLGVEFPPWAPGWGFILLGRRVGRRTHTSPGSHNRGGVPERR